MLDGLRGNPPDGARGAGWRETLARHWGLAQRTSLNVIEPRDGTPIRVGFAHLMPDGAHMTVLDGRLRVQPRRAPSSHVQLDQLFRSLAEQYRERAVGVVLSGGPSDGAPGLRETKAVGGITIAQRPEQGKAAGSGSLDGASICDQLSDLLQALSAFQRNVRGGVFGARRARRGHGAPIRDGHVTRSGSRSATVEVGAPRESKNRFYLADLQTPLGARLMRLGFWP